MKMRGITLITTVVAAMILATAVQAGTGTQQKQRARKKVGSSTTGTVTQTRQRDRLKDGSCTTTTLTPTQKRDQIRLKDGSCKTP